VGLRRRELGLDGVQRRTDVPPLGEAAEEDAGGDFGGAQEVCL